MGDNKLKIAFNNKGQIARIFDILILGPFMMWYALKTPNVGKIAQGLMFSSGLMTLLYNLQNFLGNVFIIPKTNDLLSIPLFLISFALFYFFYPKNNEKQSK